MTTPEPNLNAMQWLPEETAPKDGSKFIGLISNLVFVTWWQPFYVKWPHEEGGPTYRNQWTYSDRDSHVPVNKLRGWMPLPEPPKGAAK